MLLVHLGLHLVGLDQVKERVYYSQKVLYELSVEVDKPQEYSDLA